MNRTIKISFKQWLEWEKRGYIKKGGYSKLRTKEVSK